MNPLIEPRLRALVSQGLSDEVIGQRLNRSTQTIAAYRRDLGLLKRLPIHRIALNQRIDKLLLADPYVENNVIKERLKCTIHFIRKRRVALNLPWRRRPKAQKTRKRSSRLKNPELPTLVEYRKEYFKYNEHLAKNLEAIRAADRPDMNPEEFRDYLRTEEGNTWISRRYYEIFDRRGI